VINSSANANRINLRRDGFDARFKVNEHHTHADKGTVKPFLAVFGISLTLLTIVALAQPAASPGAAAQADSRPWLVVANGAQDLKIISEREMRYRVQQAYPAPSAIADIVNTLQLRGWEPSRPSDKEAFSHFKADWGTFLDEEDRYVTRAIHEFRASDGQVVTYVLTYRYDRDGSRWRENDVLEVLGSLSSPTRTLANLAER
jgi:hypothetical protein